MINRIAILGPESSGKTTLATALSARFGYSLVNEYARQYFDSYDYSLCNLDDLVQIAHCQFDQSRSSKSNPRLISDTEMITIEIWAQDKFGKVPSVISNLRSRQQFDLYILTTPDFPWQCDPLRTDPHRVEYLFQCYVQYLEKYKISYVKVDGSVENRLEMLKMYLLV
jgi:nicotinamide riboside kinase